ncbi:helix-turn-helix domain-containing protein [Curtanaerobium respiraculi]|uniref:helix-turn-helix domain-containing protein n=1 Tax=Curtanaerobium respiraculi TaxID=2949669 RepID=UPI0024B36854|nr:AraC family transcriptional regulator [Curtanaerobium respiraculi]
MMGDAKHTILSQFKKVPGSRALSGDAGIEIPLPSSNGAFQGKMVSVFPGGGLLLNIIDIRSASIPDCLSKPDAAARRLKVNFCAKGRCELETKSRKCTFLTAGEIAIDAGQTYETYFYPTEEYLGFELIGYIDGLDGDADAPKIPAMDDLFDRCTASEHPWIRNAGKHLADFYDVFKFYLDRDLGHDLVFLKCAELLTCLSRIDFESTQLARTYYTPSKMEIAKRARSIIMSDLSVRHTAKSLADRFGVSETSLKNYFKSVYGCGYAEFQHDIRMKKAAELLRESNDRIADISAAVGFATQAKFGVAFKNRFGSTPLEYRRMDRLNSKEVEGRVDLER